MTGLGHPILDYPAAVAAGAGRAGGKGYSLALLATLGVPVPPGFVIDATAGIGHRQGEAVPAALAAALTEELQHRGWSELALAVRSSAIAEDSAAASFAGILRSCLNVQGPSAVLDAVREVWDSWWSPAALAYRQRLGVGSEAPGVAVLIMPLLPAVAAGIAFTCDPVSGRRDELLIHAHWGLGEALVSGHADGDEYRLRLQDWDATQPLIHVSEQRGRKARMSVPRERQDAPPQGAQSQGTQLRDTPAALAARTVLAAAQRRQLAALTLESAAVLDYGAGGFDIEWVWDGRQFWIVQARPVTRTARLTYPALTSQPTCWSRMNSREVTPAPLSALEWGAARPLLQWMMTCSLKLAGYRVLPGLERVALRHGRFYVDTAVWQWEAYDAFGMSPAACTQMMGGHQPSIAVPEPTVHQRFVRALRSLRYLVRCIGPRRQGGRALRATHEQAARWRAETEPATASGLIERLQAHVRMLRGAHELLFLQASSGSMHYILFDLARRRCAAEGQGIAAAVLAGGEPSVTAAQSYELMHLAQLAAAEPVALAWLRGPGRVGAEWRDRLPQASPFRNAFAQFLERYGHRAVYESYLRSARWHEAPDYLLDSIVNLMGCDPQRLRRRQQRLAHEAQQRLRRALPLWQRPLLGPLIRLVVIERNLREGARSALMTYFEVVRRDLRALGRCWSQPGGLAGEEDVFHLTLPEVYALAEGRLSLTSAAARAAHRRRQLQTYADIEPPELILESAPIVCAPPEPAQRTAAGGAIHGAAVVGGAARAQEWHGTVAGGGVARGAARIGRQPTEALAMRDGEVLVTPSTDPSWTPLFLKAAALVMETGGYLSHGAIVAREFGIPAVVNLPDIVAQVQNGELLEVDGNHGVVRRR